MTVAIGSAAATAYFVHLLVDFIKRPVDHGSFVSDPAISDFMLVVTWQVILLVICSATISIMWRVGSAFAMGGVRRSARGRVRARRGVHAWRRKRA